MQKLQSDNEKILKQELLNASHGILKEARELKNKIVDDAKEEAKLRGCKIISQAQAAIKTEKKLQFLISRPKLPSCLFLLLKKY